MSDQGPIAIDCGCGKAPAVTHPASIENPAGRSSLVYRVATHSGFKTAMQVALGRQAELIRLTARQNDDPSIALVDAWATALDVLSFYQERIANETYLRTATERRSVLELARAIGYELSPGVAASVYLAFSLETAPGSPSAVAVNVGTRVQSIPGQDQLPQTFETVEQIEARVAWNSLQPRLTLAQRLAIVDGALHCADLEGVQRPTTKLYLSGASTNLKAGELLLVVLANDSGTREAVPLRIISVTADHNAAWTCVTFQAGDTDDTAPAKSAPRKGQRALLSSDGSFGFGNLPLNDATVDALGLGGNLSDSYLSAIAAMYHWNLADLLIILRNLSQLQSSLAAGEGVFALRAKVGFFGYNAPYHGSLLNKGAPLYENNWDGPDGWQIWKDPLSDAYYTDADVYLERALPTLVSNSWAVFELPADEGSSYSVFGIRDVHDAAAVGFGMSSKVAALKLTRLDGFRIGATDKASFADRTVRETTAYVASELLNLAELPLETPLNAGDTQIVLNGLVSDLIAGQLIALSGERADAVGVMAAEILTLATVTHGEGFTTIYLTAGLVNSYVRRTVSINANVARATHGESKTEVLGSGDGSKAFQSFKLKQRPLTYVAAATSGGSATSLAVRVNNLLWQEVPSLHGRGPSDRVYVTRRADDGTVTVAFGDGATGARAPTGVENVTATYRVGNGLDGLADAGQISLLLTRSLGLVSVTNPVASAGAADPELLAQARDNAPLTVLAMQRIVSLQDFEDFARSLAGIAKAQAALVWNGERQVVHVTIAGAGGAAVEPASELYRNLIATIDAARHADYPLQVDSYRTLLFSVSGRLRVDATFVASDVIAAVTAALMDAFSFERRNFGQAVLKSEVLAVMQSVPGVVAVDLDALYSSTAASALITTLTARSALWDGVAIAPAELMMLHPVGVVLTEMI
ncbi:MAG TPA: putative baseplate assembly protein [Steroidobacter sp.]